LPSAESHPDKYIYTFYAMFQKLLSIKSSVPAPARNIE